MPKVTFFNLPDDKQDKLIHAAKEEFSRVPLAKASISNIVNAAQIPRGSFYQYFEDKSDAFFYLLNIKIQENRERMVELIQKNEGDIFKTISDLFEYLITEQDQNLHFMKNIFLNMDHRIEHEFERSFHWYDTDKQMNELNQMINKRNLNMENEDEYKYIIKILGSVLIRSVIEKYSLDLSIEKAIKEFSKEMVLLKKGLHK
ncbi:TetR/AcrR family transcriptional regulator [Alkalihalobacillus trypoxylicola]|uniref:TetR family transcriptional regulator n=1 Tax=Alkalihalobacillus trypoxylicola TaxID=519424 RepID=A0A161PDJ5_9BACI|nr:TetR family transcriptional regulator [Alkalihalobacillus trypoxylicola]KYG26028.1 TetR family transcriptional regulator [Alkalihalobacillus trypoxylicola]